MMRPDISVLLPTIRPHLIQRAIESIRPAAHGLSYEIIVVADFDAAALSCRAPEAHLHVRWIQEPRRGVIAAINTAYREAHGEYVFLFNDESTLDFRALRILHGEAQHTPEAILSPRHVPDFPFRYYGLPFVPFPFATKTLFDRLGGLMDPIYKGFYADPDLSMRAHAAGVPLRVIDAAVLRHTNRHDAPHKAAVDQYLLADRATFRSRWDHLGEFADP